MTTFATVNDVRIEAGFTGNANITNELIEKYLIAGHSIVISSIAGKYSIPELEGALFTGSQAEQFLKTCEILISAGLLIQKEYGAEVMVQGEGEKKIKQGKDMLMQLYDTKFPTRLININGDEYGSKSISQAGPVVGAQAVTSAPLFTVNDKR